MTAHHLSLMIILESLFFLQASGLPSATVLGSTADLLMGRRSGFHPESFGHHRCNAVASLQGGGGESAEYLDSSRALFDRLRGQRIRQVDLFSTNCGLRLRGGGSSTQHDHSDHASLLHFLILIPLYVSLHSLVWIIVIGTLSFAHLVELNTTQEGSFVLLFLANLFLLAMGFGSRQFSSPPGRLLIVCFLGLANLASAFLIDRAFSVSADATAQVVFEMTPPEQNAADPPAADTRNTVASETAIIGCESASSKPAHSRNQAVGLAKRLLIFSFSSLSLVSAGYANLHMRQSANLHIREKGHAQPRTAGLAERRAHRAAEQRRAAEHDLYGPPLGEVYGASRREIEESVIEKA